MIDYETKEYKAARVAELKSINIKGFQLEEIDERLEAYTMEVQRNPDAHNLFEILAVIKFFRLYQNYIFKPKKVRKFVRLYESLKFSGLDGRRCYRLTPVQYFQFANILGFYTWEYTGEAPGMQDREGQREKVEGGKRYELRRLCRFVILFVPRKFSKTTSVASLAVNELLKGDANAEAYTAANSFSQASLCFKEIKKILRQLDPKKKNFKTLREKLLWKEGNKYKKESFVECLTGGADTKDGLNASLVIYDEYAAAKYVRGHSDGAELFEVLCSSMGVRKEPLVVIITTAGRNPETPFATELQNAKNVLLGEWDDDTQFAHIFEPDAWERDEESLGTAAVWRKCNPHIGITVQENYYRSAWEKALHDAEKMAEFKCKLVNIFVSGAQKVWISNARARTLQRDFDITETKGKPMCMVGVDLSVSDDLSAVVYNIYSHAAKKFYCWLECYIPEETLRNHPNHQLYKIWVEAGWLKVCPGEILDYRMITNDILEKRKYVSIKQIGYDSYKSGEMVNGLAAALAALGNDPDKILRAVPQTNGGLNSPTESLEIAAKSDPPRLVLSKSPIYPYAFGNAILLEDNHGLKRPWKKKENQKIDPVAATVNTFWLYNNYIH